MVNFFVPLPLEQLKVAGCIPIDPRTNRVLLITSSKHEGVWVLVITNRRLCPFRSEKGNSCKFKYIIQIAQRWMGEG
jgi:hypothetical protein